MTSGAADRTGPPPRADAAGTANALSSAVATWLQTLDADQRARAVFPFETPERFVWAYTPGSRNGLALGEMADRQRRAAMSTVEAAMSDRGTAEVRAIIDLEPILGEIERVAGRVGTNRDPDLYWFAVFGDPAGTAPWSWRVGGHHVALHTTLAAGRVIGATPSFLGANPATVPSGQLRGHRAIDGEERLARDLLTSLSESQRAIAVVDPVAPPDIRSGNGRRADLADIPIGVGHGQLEPAQQTALEGLIGHYLDRYRPDVAGAEWDRIRAAGLESVTFAWAGPDGPGHGHYYAVRGPTLLLEYDNTQNGANHIHSVWRDPANDWGEDLLADHYRTSHPG